MMNLKDFKVGQIAYALSYSNGRTKEYFLKKYTVVSVGRKYLKAAPETSPKLIVEFFLNNETNNFLSENKDWGYREMLFLTEEAANNYIEKDNLKKWLSRATEYCKINTYTLDQLRAVKKILEETDVL